MNPVAEEFLRWFKITWDLNLGWENARFVVLDTESTGLDQQRDRIVSIGAVGCYFFELSLDDVFEVVLPISHNTSAVHIHGITREQAAAKGVPEPEALQRFLRYLRDGIIVGHHVSHDIGMIEAACQRHFGLERLPNHVVDTMDLTLRLESLGGMTKAPWETNDFSLDGLCERFGIALHDRHTASGDAFLTAQVFLKLLKRAKRCNLLRLGQLTEPFKPDRD